MQKIIQRVIIIAAIATLFAGSNEKILGQIPPDPGGECTNCPPYTNTYVPPSYVPGLKMNISPSDGTNFLLSLLEADSAGKYDIYFATNLISATWNDTLQGTNGQTNFILSFPVSQSGFFRAARTDPAVADAGGISFYFLNGFVNSNITSAVVNGGVAAATAIVVDSTNFAGATWIPFSSMPLVDIGTNEGVHEVWFGFMGTNGIVYWTSDTVTLDRTPPVIVITNPVSSTTSRPIIQVQGYSLEPLSSIYFDVINDTGGITNLQGFVTEQNFDTNQFKSTTNWLQCFDVELTNGVNTIVVHAADLAGNVTTTNINIALDFSGDTNPPVISLTWPQDGAQISGTNFTLRGVLDDETAQVMAQLVDTNGVTNIVSGTVERNGTFWLEDLPLNMGANSVSIIATDAAGNSSVTNLTVFQSGVILTINPVSDDQLNQSFATVSGTVSDPSYGVWVNGVPMTVDSSGHWTTNNVPVYGKGTATFDAIAYPPGQSPNLRIRMNANSDPSPVQASQVSEQPPVVFVNQYSDNWYDTSFVAGSFGGSKNYNATIDNSGHLSFQGNGTFFSHLVQDYGGWTDTTYNWSDADPIGTYTTVGVDIDGEPVNETGSGYGDFENPDPYGIPSVSWDYTWVAGFTISHCYASIGYTWTGDSGSKNYGRSSKTFMKLRTGGKSGISKKTLFKMSAGAMEYGRPSYIDWCPDEWYGTLVTGIAPDRIRVLGKNLGNDGNLFIVLPDNATLDLGATAPGRHYSLGVGATKHKLAIFANGNPLVDDRVRVGANFCAGQNVSFSPHFYPDLPAGTVSSKTAHWNFTGQFVTAWTQWVGMYGGTYFYGSKDYYLDNSVLALENSYAWWTKGGNPAPEQETATLGIMVEFANGQKAFLKRTGLFTMYQPGIDFQIIPPPAAVHIDYISMVIALRIGKNISSGQLTDLMGFTADIHSDVKFPGEIIATQLINRNSSIDGIPFSGTDGSFWLDASETYPNSHDNVIRQQPTAPYCYGQSLFSDGPGIGIQIASWASINDTLKTYFRFRPSGGNSIWVTLGRVDWNWFGSVEYTGLNPLDPNSWTLTTSGIGGPYFSPTDEPPQWHLTYLPEE